MIASDNLSPQLTDSFSVVCCPHVEARRESLSVSAEVIVSSSEHDP